MSKKKIEVWGTTRQKVIIDPINVLEEIHIIPEGDWITLENGEYFQMTEESAGQHSFSQKVKKVSKEVFEVHNAKFKLIKYLRENEKI